LIVENFPNYQKEKLFDIQYYELIVFHKARALYNLKKYKDSKLLFDRLDKAFPNNDKYQSWILGIKAKKYDYFIWSGTGVILADLILRTFLKGKFPLFDKLSLWILIFALIFSATFEIIKRIELKKRKKRHKTRGLVNCRYSANSSSTARIKSSCNLIER